MALRIQTEPEQAVTSLLTHGDVLDVFNGKTETNRNLFVCIGFRREVALVAAVASTLPKSTSMYKNQDGKQRLSLIFTRISVKSAGALNESSIWPAVLSRLVLPAPLH